MSAALREIAPAKINLSLRIIGRRPDGYHDLESLVVFADFGDTLSLEPGDLTAVEIAGRFASASGAATDNLILKAARAAGLRAGTFSLEKNIPAAAGLGGGSADAAAALRLIARANGLATNDARLVAAARAIGADVPVCLDSRARIMRGIGDRLSEPLALPRLPALLVNPGGALPTAQVFAAFRAERVTAPPTGNLPLAPEKLRDWLERQDNDLTAAAIATVPAIADMLSALRALPGCWLARMSGSGATCFGLFDSTTSAAAAAPQLSATYRNWWICPTTLG